MYESITDDVARRRRSSSTVWRLQPCSSTLSQQNSFLELVTPRSWSCRWGGRSAREVSDERTAVWKSGWTEHRREEGTWNVNIWGFLFLVTISLGQVSLRRQVWWYRCITGLSHLIYLTCLFVLIVCSLKKFFLWTDFCFASRWLIIGTLANCVT